MANGLIKAMWRVLRNGRDSAGARCKPESRKKFQLESMEARILFSADIAGALELAGSSPEDSASHPSVITASNFETPATLPAGGSDSAAIDSPSTELVFVDAGVTGYDRLLADLVSQNDGEHQVVVHVLDGKRDGIEQISEVLAGYSGLDAVHIISHGSDGTIDLGGSTLDSASLQANAGLIATWGEALGAEADLLIYGCNLAATGAGQSLVTAIGNLTGADVAASDDLTGSAVLGGDWKLEYVTGNIEASIAISEQAQHDWSGTLAVINVNTTADVVDGADGFTSLREAIIAANANADHDTIMLGAGSYDLTILNGGPAENAADRGDLDINGDVTILGSGSASTIIDAGAFATASDADRVFDILGGSVLIKDVQILNGSGGGGGGIYVRPGANLSLQHTVISGNVGGDGGAILNDGSLDVRDTVISNNSASWGGAIESGGVLTLTRVYLTGNGSNGTINADRGGALYNWGTATLEDVTISGNTADSGAGIYEEFGSLSLTNVTLSGNTAISRGGAIYSQQSQITATNVTITGNSAADSGGLYLSGGAADVILKNSIIANNTATLNPNSSRAITSLGNNIIDDLTTITAPVTTPGEEDQVNTDPLLDPVLDFNGGLTPTHALLAASPAIDAGNASGAPLFDQRGITRDAAPDIGAFEFDVQTSLWFSTSGAGDTGSATWDDNEVVQFSNPNLKYDPQDGTTDGTFSLLPGFTAPYDIRAMHYVGSAITIGTTGNQTVLQEGDLLLTLDPGNTEVTAAGVTFDRHDILLFRPTVAGDYSSGTWSMLLDEGIHDDTKVYNSHAITLVEQDTLVGGTVLQAGSFIVARSTPSEHDNLYVVNVIGAGAGAATQTDDMQLLLDGDLLGFSNMQVQGLELVENSTKIGTETLAPGTLLMALKNSSPLVVAGSVSVEAEDVFYLNVSSTEIDAPGSTAATATLLFDGSDVGMEATPPLGQDERINALTLAPEPNNTPVVANVAINAAEDGASVTASFVVTDDDPADTHTFLITSAPGEGSVANNGNGTFTFDPGSDFQDLAEGETRVVSFTYTASDDSGTGNATSNTATVNVTVTGSNDTPLVSDLVFVRTEDDGSKDFSFVVNDLDDNDNHTFTITSTLPAGSGTLVNKNDGKFSFDPGSDFQDLAEGESRDVIFTYSAADDSGMANAGSNTATVTITVTGKNDRPVVSNVVISAFEDGVSVTGSFVVNDIDDTDMHVFTITSAPAEGSVVNNGNGTFTFDPGADFQDLAEGETRVVSFDYKATDDSGAGNAVSANGKVSVTVTGGNDRPVVSDLVFTRTEDEGSKDFSFVVNDVDDDDSHTFTLTSTLPAGSGTLVNENDGKFSFDPGSDFQDLAEGETRDVSFTYRATDNSGTANAISTDAMVTITVTGKNDRPVVSDIVINAIEDGLAVTGSFVVSDIDDSDAHTFDITSNPDEGSVLNNNDGTFSFDPGSDFQDLSAGETRVVSFEYEATDDSGGGSDTSAKASVSVTVTGSNDAPLLDNTGDMALASTGSQATNPAGTSVAAIIASAGGDRISDADSAALEGIAVTGVDDANGEWQYNIGSGWTAFGSVSDTKAVLLDPAALVRFVADAGYFGTVDLGFRAWDQTAGSNGQTGMNVLLDNGGDTAFSQGSETATVTVVDGVLWLTTEHNVSSGGASGLDAWEKGDLLLFGSPDLSLAAPATSGSFAAAFDIDRFAPGANTNAVHHVTRDMQLGSSGFQLKAGDLLLSLDQDSNTLASTSVPTAPGFMNTLTVKDNDVFVFRPDSAGDYSAGTFAMLLENPLGADIRALTLVQQSTTVGDTVLQKGDFLMSASGDVFDKKITLWETDDVGAGSTSGIPVTLLNGTDVNVKISGHIWGIDLVEKATSTGGQTLGSGTILLSVHESTDVGKNNLSVKKSDVFALAVTKTSLVAGTGNGEATASMFFAGADVGLDSGDEHLDGLALVFVSPNNAPLATDDGSLATPLSTAEDTAVAIDVLANDTDPDGSLDPATVSIVSGPLHGALSVNAVSGMVTYSPDADYSGSDAFSYTVRDDSGDTSNLAQVTLEVTAVNDAPVVTPVDLGNSDEDAGRMITQAELLAGASDVDNLSADLTAVNLAVTGGSGTLIDHADGSWTFTPALNWNGAVTFSFAVSDGAASTPNTASLAVDALNDAPQVDPVVTDTGTQDTDQTYSHDELLALVNAYDVDDADTGLIIGISNVVNGSLVLSGGTGGADTTFTFTPDPGFNGILGFDYQVADAAGALSATGNASLNIIASNNPPLASDDGSAALPLDTAEDTPLDIDVLANDSDPDGSLDPATVNIGNGPANGTVSVHPVTGLVTYTPDANYAGSDSFTYTVRDNNGAVSNLAEVYLEVAPVNDAPVANDDGSVALPVGTAEDTPVAIDVLANDTDLDGSLDPATISITSGPASGTLGLNAVTGVVTYTPDADFTGSDGFSYTVRDDSGAISNSARVILEVTPVNDAPLVIPIDLGTIDEDTDRFITQADLLAGVSDIDNLPGDLVAQNLVLTGGSGTLLDHVDGSWTFRLTDNWNGTVTFSFSVSDGAASTPNMATLSVDPVSDAPDISGVDSAALTEDDNADLDGLLEAAAALLINDPDSGESAFTAATLTGTYGELTIDAAGNWIYVADNSQAAIQTLADGATLTDTLTVTSVDGTPRDVLITITGVNDAPTLASPLQDQDVSENAAFLFTFALNAFDDIDGDTLVYSVTQGDGSALPAWLSFDAAGRTLSGTPTPADVGMIVLKVTADDGKGGVVSDEFTLTVKEVNTLPIVVISPPDPGTGEPSPPVDGGTPDPSTGDPGEEQTTQPPRAAGGDPVENGPSAEPEGSVEEAPAESGSETSADKEVVEEAPAEDEAAAQEADTATEQAGSADSSTDSNGIGLRSGQGKLLQIGGFVKELNEQRELIHERDYFQHTVVGSTMTVTTGLSVGYVVWLIRGGVLLSSLLSSLPAWRWVDPLPVLASLARDSEDDEDDESLETIVEGSEEEPESETDPDDDKTAEPEKTVKDHDE